jgi:hypothetical protein
MKFWIRKSTTKDLWLKVIEHPAEVTPEEKARLLSRSNLDIANLLMKSMVPEDSTSTRVVIVLICLWCWLSIFAVIMWHLS